MVQYFLFIVSYYILPENGVVPLLTSQKSAFPQKLVTVLSSWQSVVWNDYKQLLSTQHLVKDQAVTEADTLYRAAFSRGSGKFYIHASFTIFIV